jgi:hypothetical protein
LVGAKDGPNIYRFALEAPGVWLDPLGLRTILTEVIQAGDVARMFDERSVES